MPVLTGHLLLDIRCMRQTCSIAFQISGRNSLFGNILMQLKTEALTQDEPQLR